MVSRRCRARPARRAPGPRCLSWSIIVSWYGDCHSPAWPTLSGLVWVNACMWVKLHQTKNGVARGVLALDVIDCDVRRLRRRWSPSASCSAARCLRWSACRPARTSESSGSVDTSACGLALEHAARMRQLVEQRELILVRIVRLLGFFLGVEVIQVAEELVEPVHRRQVLVQVANDSCRSKWFLPNWPVA